MVGADDSVGFDYHMNTAFVGSQSGLSQWLADCKSFGFAVEGNKVLATRRAIEIAFATSNMRISK